MENSSRISEHHSHAPLNISQKSIDEARISRFCSFTKFSHTILLSPLTTTTKFTFRLVKLMSWDCIKSGLYKISGYHTDSNRFLETQYLKTVKAARDVLFIPSTLKRTFVDMIAKREPIIDNIPPKTDEEILKNVSHVKKFEQFFSFLYGTKTLEVIQPEITELPAANDPTLKAVMASHLFQPEIMGINFGTPNVASFMTTKENEGVQTIKVDAKSLRREEMSYHATNGKLQSGIFFIPSNLPEGALERFEEAAKKLEGRKDITCVNTNCRVLKEAGFSIEGVVMEDIIFPNTFAEHLMFRNVFYKDEKGIKHKIHFKILNTTNQTLEKFFENVDTAVVGTRLRHRIRHADTEADQRARGIAAKALIEEERKRLASTTQDSIEDNDLEKRKVTVSVPSLLGTAISRIWGRHTMYELDLSENKKDITEAFKESTSQDQENSTTKLRPFPQAKPNFSTRLKRDFLFSAPVIRFLRRHMMGREDTIYLHTQDIFKHLRSTAGERFNYVLLDDKIVIARIQANSNQTGKHRKIADWALSKHALLSNREDVYCSGEMWYDEEKKQFMMNDDSGTYKPTVDRVKKTADLINRLFDSEKFGHSFVPSNGDV